MDDAACKAAPVASKRAEGAAPELQLGCMNFGGRLDAALCERIVRDALDRGVRWFDTANAYQNGESERLLGRALKGARQRAQIASKVGFRREGAAAEGLRTEVITAQCEQSLRRLNVDYIDLYYLHVPDHQTPLRESLSALAALQKAGKIRAWGASNYASWQLLEMLQLADELGMSRPLFAQQLYNPLIRQLDLEYARFSAKYNLSTVIYNPLAGGLLSGRHQPGAATKGSRFDKHPFYQRRYWHKLAFDHVEALRPLAARLNLSLVQLSYAWLRSRAVVDQVLVGPSALEHLACAQEALAHKLPAEILAEMDALHIHFSATDTAYAR